MRTADRGRLGEGGLSVTEWRYAVQLAYVGSRYCGWQRQADAMGVQEALETALSRLSPAPVKVTGAGRTDRGVHALGQVASFALGRRWREERLRLAVNFHLPEDVRVMRLFSVPPSFSARYSALWREYRYFVWHGWVCPPHMNGLVWWRTAPWDTDLARDACRALEGEHDFRAFCQTGECPERSVRRLDRVRLQRWGPMTVLTVRAPSFLMNMVRIIAGSIDAVARGERPLAWLESLLQGAPRKDAAMTAPACGLWFWRAAYREIPLLPPMGGEGAFFGPWPSDLNEDEDG